MTIIYFGSSDSQQGPVYWRLPPPHPSPKQTHLRLLCWASNEHIEVEESNQACWGFHHAVGFPYPEAPLLQPGDEGFIPIGATASPETAPVQPIKPVVAGVKSYKALLGCKMLTGDKHPVNFSKVSVLSHAGTVWRSIREGKENEKQQ